MRRSLNYWCFLLLFFISSSCSHHLLVVQTQYLSRNSLASYHVETPDPKLENPDIGQRLIINWHLPKKTPIYQQLYLHMKVRFHNKEEDSFSLKLNKTSGVYTYTLLNADFFKKRGILTYKVELVGDDKIIDVWQHPLWTNWIILENQPSENSYEY